jgi:hypothetical protein
VFMYIYNFNPINLIYISKKISKIIDIEQPHIGRCLSSTQKVGPQTVARALRATRSKPKKKKELMSLAPGTTGSGAQIPATAVAQPVGRGGDVPTVVRVDAVLLPANSRGDIAICRGCRREFTRDNSIPEGVAAYYRCTQCGAALKSNFFELNVIRDTCTIL